MESLSHSGKVFDLTLGDIPAKTEDDEHGQPCTVNMDSDAKELIDLRQSPLKTGQVVLPNFHNPTIVPLLLNANTETPELIHHFMPPNDRQEHWYIIDLTSLPNPDDIKVDNCGSWFQTNVETKTYSIHRHDTGKIVAISKDKNGELSAVRRTYKCRSNENLRKLLVTIFISKEKFCLAFLQYFFYDQRGQKSFHVKKHGNNKDDFPFFPTAASTKDKLRKATGSVKKALFTVTKEVGGIEAPASILPRNDRQVLYEKGKSNTKSCDPMLGVWQMMQGSYKSFIQEYSLANTSPRVILFNEQQLDDLLKFCCHDQPDHLSLYMVDVTFKLGPFFLLVTCYRNPMLRVIGTTYSPPLLGPMMIFKQKTEETYQAFFDFIACKEPGLKFIKAIGSDDERELTNATKKCFSRSKSLLCVIQQKKNVQEKIRTIGLSSSTAKVITQDIFDKPDGLVFKTTAEEYYDAAYQLQSKWMELEMAEKTKCEFVPYFMKNKLNMLEQKSSAKAMIDIGFDSGPFNNNMPAALNHTIKSWQEFQSVQMDDFIKSMHDLVENQEIDVSRAWLGIGQKYVVRDEFSHFKPKVDFGNMTQEQKKKFSQEARKYCIDKERFTELKKLKKQVPLDCDNPNWSDSFAAKSLSQIDTHVLQPLENHFSSQELVAMKNKAQLLLTSNSVCAGFGDKNNFFVKSSTETRPHSVKGFKNGKMVCTCQNYRSNNICSHCIAAAAKGDKLQMLMNWYNDFSANNVTRILTRHTSNAGQKGFNGLKRKSYQLEVTNTEEPLTVHRKSDTSVSYFQKVET